MADFLDIEERIQLAVRIGESHYREFKSAWSGPPMEKTARLKREVMADIARALVAFANADGGELILGVEDDGTVTGMPWSSEVIAEILQAPQTHVHNDTPLPALRKRVVTVNGHQVMYFNVSKGAQYIHLTTDGRCLKRVDRETMPFSTERITAMRLDDLSRTWDRDPMPRATLDDLNLDLVESVASQVAYGISVEKCLQHLDLAEFTSEGLRLKKAAVMLFAKDIRKWYPHCSVRMMTVSGREKRSGEAFNVVKDVVIATNILHLVEQAWEHLISTLSMHTQLTESARFQQSFMYPQIACREALMNAIVHRNYAIEGRGIEVSIFQDRLEILSPGMILSTISLDDVRALTGVHESRNPLIARVLREVGFIREMGEGIRRMFDVMRSNALAEPELTSDTTGFTVTLFHRSLYDPNVKLWLSNFEQLRLTESQVAVLALGYGGKEFSTQDIIDRLGIVNIDQVREILTPLRNIGVVVRTKSKTDEYSEAKRKRIPVREVPRFRAVSPEEIAPEESESAADDNISDVEKIHAIFLRNLEYGVTRAQLYSWLSRTCEVLELGVPPSELDGARNRGYAYATVRYEGETSDLLSVLDGRQISGRPVHALKQR